MSDRKAVGDIELEQIYRTVPVGLCLLDTDLRYVRINDRLAEINGKPASDHIGRSISEIIPDLDPFLKPSLRKILETGEPMIVDVEGSPTGDPDKTGVFVCNYQAVRSDEGEVIGISVVVHDLTERKRVEKLLATSEALYQTLVETAPQIIWQTSAEGANIFINKAWEEMTGLSQEDALGSGWLQVVHPDDVSALVAMWKQAYEQGVRYSGECRFRAKDGSYRTINFVGKPVRDQENRIILWVGINTDITEWEKREQERHVAQSQRLETIGRLAGGVAHDFNNIMTVIAGYSAVIGEALPDGSQEKQQLGAVERAVGRGTALTRQLLAFSRKQHVETRVLDINPLLGEVLWVLRRTIGEDLTLNSNLKSSWHVKADPAQLEQVILNLATNARDAMPDGGKLSIETSDVVLEGEETTGAGDRNSYFPESIPSGSYVQLKVTDTGMGMDRDTVMHVFEPFYTTKERGEGTGLGLPAVYGIVAQAGGSVSVESEVGQGSSFYVYLPKTEEVVKPIEKVVQKGTLDVGQGSILLIEDDEEILDLALLVLEKGGYTVLSAAKPQDALDHYSGESIDLILTDVVMPGMSGPNFVGEWEKQNPATKVLYMSGYIDESLGHHSIPERVITESGV